MFFGKIYGSIFFVAICFMPLNLAAKILPLHFDPPILTLLTPSLILPYIQSHPLIFDNKLLPHVRREREREREEDLIIK